MSEPFNDQWLERRYEQLIDSGMSPEDAEVQAAIDYDKEAGDYTDMEADRQQKEEREQ